MTLNLLVHVLGPEAEGQSDLSCRLTPDQLKRIGIQAAKICAAGRPRCPLCGGPIDPEGHICPKTN